MWRVALCDTLRERRTISGGATVSKQELQLRRVALMSALVVLLAGGALMVAPALLPSAAPARARNTSTTAVAVGSVAPAVAAPAPPLPTIARPTSTQAATSAPNDQVSPSPIRPDTSAGSLPTEITREQGSAIDSQLTARLVAHLQCI